MKFLETNCVEVLKMFLEKGPLSEKANAAATWNNLEAKFFEAKRI